MNDEQYFLANAYLDGELTAEERAIAESDPEVMAEVAELRALQELLRDVDPPDDATRRRAIAAAMAELTDAAGATAAGRPPAPAPIPYRPRPAYGKYLAVAAGVLGVGLLGVTVANLGTGGDDDASESAVEPAAEEPAEEPAERITEEADVMAADDAGDQVTSGAVPEGAAEEPAMEPAAEEPAAEEPAELPLAEEPAEEPMEEPAEEPASEPADGAGAERPVLEPGQVLTTPEELGSYGTGLFEQQRAGTLPPTPNHACPIDDVLGQAEYRVDATPVPILVAVDEPARMVLAFEDDTCDFVVAGPLYLP